MGVGDSGDRCGAGRGLESSTHGGRALCQHRGCPLEGGKWACWHVPQNASHLNA